MTGRLQNWAGNITYQAQRVHRPTTIDQLQDLVAGSDNIRALGSGHSFNRIADCAGDLVSVAALPPVIAIDPECLTATTSAGVRYGELTQQLEASGHALPNLGSLPHISVAGACATGTHGSGVRNGILATSVAALEMVTADGRLVSLSRADDADFAGSVVALGGLGVVTSLTLDVLPTFCIRQYVYDDLPVSRLHQLDEIMASAYSVSLFTDWDSPTVKQVWVKSRAGDQRWEPAPGWLDATLADGPRHPVPGMPSENCTQQLGVAGPWHERLPHFRREFTPSSGEEVQSEYLLPRARAGEAVEAMLRLGHLMRPVLQVSELRTVASDDLWLSPSYAQDSVGFHFTWTKDADAVAPVVSVIEDELIPLGGRPHWGKVFSVGPEATRGCYERAADFDRLLAQHDPAGKFRNDFINRFFPAG